MTDRGSGGGPERLTPEALGVDLDVDDPRVAWAIGAKASSEWSSSYAASTACGPPCVFPKGGDIYNSWLAERDDRDPWIELELPPVSEAVAILVLETCGPGAVHEIRDVERDAVLYEAKPERIRASRSARALHVPLAEGTPPPRRVRLRVAPYEFGSEYHEIDAIALLTVPLETLRATPARLPPATHRRYAPDALELHDLRGDPRIVWATGARASSEYSSSYAAKDATGRPKVFPRGGDIAGTWLSENDDRHAWIELRFPKRERAFGFIVLETCGAGAVVKATDAEGATLWQARPEPVEGREARLLHVPLEASPAPETLRLWVSGSISDYREIDAVALLTAPFEELAEEAPPPPPPPIPGEPSGGFAMLEGELIGASAERPFVHATLRTPSEGRAANHGGPLGLRVSNGDVVELETGRTTLYGAPLVRARGTWAEVSREAPWLAAAFADAPPPDDVEVVLEGRRLVSELHVEVAGEVSAQRQGGFRESARGAPERVVAHAIAVGPLAQTPFETEGTDAFARDAKPHRPRPTTPHPLAGWARGMGIAIAACATVIAIAVALPGGALEPIPPLALLVALVCATFGLELFACMRAVPGLVRFGGSLVDRKVGFTTPGWTFFVIAFAGAMAALPVGALTAVGVEGPAYLLLPSLVPALIALVRLALLLHRHGRALLAAARVATAPAAASTVGARGRFTGALASGVRCSRSESYIQCAEHLGTETTTDSEGRTVTHDRWRHWNERHVSTRAQGSLQLVRPDGGVVSAAIGTVPESTDLRLVPQKPSKQTTYASFASEHAEGDEATILGTVSEVDPLVVKPTLVVLGEHRELRRRVLAQSVAIVGLLAIVALPIVILAFG